jgi:hypothetical protein
VRVREPMDEYARLYRRREQQRRRRRRRRVVGLLGALGLLAFGGYFATRMLSPDESTGLSKIGSGPNVGSIASRTAPTVGTHTSRIAPVRTDFLTAADRESFRRLERNLGGSSGLAASAIGLKPAIEVGTLRDGVAWSTIKVPIAVALERRAQGHATASEQSLLRRAITASDNAAAEALWSSLGTPNAAATAVQTILATAGDTSTRVETRILRAGFTSFGQTRWSLPAQQHFIASLPCLPNSEPVLLLMQQVVPDQRWGLGSLGAETQFKGGWGPDARGGYLVRQMGIVRLRNGRPLAVSIATSPADGSFDTGTANLTQIAQWLVTHVDARRVPPSRCGA